MELMNAQEARLNMTTPNHDGEDVVDRHLDNINRLIYLSSQNRQNCATYQMNMSRKIIYNTEMDSDQWEYWEDKLNDIVTILRQKGYVLELSTYDIYEMANITITINW